MKKQVFLFLLFSSLSLWSWAQPAPNATAAIQFIKLGNTLREIDKPQQAIDLLLRALPVVQGKDLYWEAVTYEHMGLAYADQEKTVDAVRYYQKAPADLQAAEIHGQRDGHE